MDKRRKRLRQKIDLIEGAGGHVEMSDDGHAKVFSSSGKFVVKMRAHGGNDGSGTDRAKTRQMLKRIREE